MAILKVARLGHPVLRERSKEVSKSWCQSPEARQFINDLVETMHEYNGVGLAAPQVHQPIRVAVIETGPNPRYPDAPERPLTILINPEILSCDTAMEEDWEGCLSIPDLRGRVPRAVKLEVSAIDETGKPRKFSADGFFARAVQHEIDHLDGKVYLDRMADMTNLAFLDEYSRHHSGDESGQSE